jgi:uncharacterized membrane protein YbhN (UPF0104 family)
MYTGAPQPEPASARWWFLGRLAVSLALVAWLALNVEWRKVWAIVSGVSLPWLLASLFYIPVSIALVAWRYRILVNNRVAFPAMLRLVVFQGAVSTFLANAAGSLGFVGLLVKVYKVATELAVQSTLIARAGDMGASMLVAALLCTMAWPRLAAFHTLILLATALSVAILLGAAVAVVVARKGSVPAIPDGEASMWRKFAGFCGRVARLDSAYLASVLPATLLHSLALQAVIAVAMVLNARAFGLEIGFLEAALVGVASSFLASVPITVFGGLGVYEVSTVGLLAVFGVPVEAGAGMILVVRAIFFLAMACAFVLVRPPGQ